jgi:hypothetical protein
MYHISDPVDVYPAIGGVRRPASLDCRRSRTLSGGLPPDPVSRLCLPSQVRDLRLSLFIRLWRAPNLLLREHLVRKLTPRDPRAMPLGTYGKLSRLKKQ